ncbi:MAG: glycerophosphodiester phosphodiesterase [Deltaproteobacteria bacterium]|nr:glycerophosphodiester phosphodiesterase [Deltaproteobacteria bacterium]
MKVFAHRGASKEAPENSIEAIQIALELGVDAIEIDCMLSKDYIPVVTHYDDLSCLYKIRGKVHQTPYAELKRLGIPKLIDVLEMVRLTSMQLILDMKAQPGILMQKGAKRIARLAQDVLEDEQIHLSSFYFRHHLVWRTFFNSLRRGAILWRGPFTLLPIFVFKKILGLHSIHPHWKSIQPPQVQVWHKHDLKVYTWVANTKEEIAVCKNLGVDGIFTDDPRFALMVLNP